MDYHQPDSTWSIWNYNDFETYRNTLVVKGLFHPLVPDDVVKSYEVAEYIIAHAYYHYPMYDEALSKLLRITEMAIKQKCTQLGIALQKEKSGKLEDKKLFQLINELSASEPAKNIKEKLHWLRRLRNVYMHPERYSFAGAMVNSALKSGINLLNELFITEATLQAFSNRTIEINKHLTHFSNGLFVLDHNGSRYLITGIQIHSSVKIQNEWHYFLSASPVMKYTEEFRPDNSYAEPFRLFIKNLRIADQIKAFDTELNKEIIIMCTSKEEDVQMLKTFKDLQRTITKENQDMFNLSIITSIAKKETDFSYSFLHLT